MIALMVAAAIDWGIFATEPFPQQRAALADGLRPEVRTVCAFAGLQGGKTLWASDLMYALLYGPDPVRLPDQMRNRRAGEVWLASKSYLLARVVLETFRSRTPPGIWLSDKQCRQGGLKRDDRDHYWLAPRAHADDPWPVSLRVRTASDPDALRATPNLMAMIADELAHWTEAAWRNCQGRGIVTRPKYVVATTPKGRNFVYRDLCALVSEGSTLSTDGAVCVHRWTSADNPWADPVYIERLRKKFGPQYAAQELDAQFVANVGYVYDFDRLRHMAALPSANPDDYDKRVAGVDPGYGDPYAAALCLREKATRRWWIADELYLPSKAIVDDAVPKLLAWSAAWKLDRIYVDKRRPSDWEALRRKGLDAVPNLDVFGEDDRRTVMPMVRMIQRLYREDRLRVAPQCEWFAEEAENYAFPERDERNQGENPIDYRNHMMDAHRYAICSVEAVPEDLRPRYRQGQDQMPRADAPKLDPSKLPSPDELLRLQDEKIEKEAEAWRNRR